MKLALLFACCLLAGCGPPDRFGEAWFEGWVTDPDNRDRPGQARIFETGPGRVHIDMDYGTWTKQSGFSLCDGDGAEWDGGSLFFPDGGGELSLATGGLTGCLYSAHGEFRCLGMVPVPRSCFPHEFHANQGKEIGWK